MSVSVKSLSTIVPLWKKPLRPQADDPCLWTLVRSSYQLRTMLSTPPRLLPSQPPSQREMARTRAARSEGGGGAAWPSEAASSRNPAQVQRVESLTCPPPVFLDGIGGGNPPSDVKRDEGTLERSSDAAQRRFRAGS